MAMEDQRRREKERKKVSLSLSPSHATDVEGDEMDRKDRQERTFLMDA
jgi:hypothetical protein